MLVRKGKEMNIYVATKNNLVGMVLTGTHNKIYMFKAFQTETTDKEAQTILATRRAVAFVRNNKVLYGGDDINIYTKDDINLDGFRDDEYLSRFDYLIQKKEVVTDKEKRHLQLATTEIEMENRRMIMRGNLER
jgi:hypothetical protein